jgi:hypothetical protein
LIWTRKPPACGSPAAQRRASSSADRRQRPPAIAETAAMGRFVHPVLGVVPVRRASSFCLKPLPEPTRSKQLLWQLLTLCQQAMALCIVLIGVCCRRLPLAFCVSAVHESCAFICVTMHDLHASSRATHASLPRGWQMRPQGRIRRDVHPARLAPCLRLPQSHGNGGWRPRARAQAGGAEGCR